MNETLERATHAGASLTPLRRGDLTIHELDDEALIYDPATADTHRLNATALFIWQQCDGRRDARVIAEGVVDAFDVTMATANEHVERILCKLRERHLFVPAS